MTSFYPDGTTNPQWNTNLRIVLPQREGNRAPSSRVPIRLVRRIVCNRVNGSGREEYLVQWRHVGKQTPYSWHGLNELGGCLVLVQEYIERCGAAPRQSRQQLSLPGIPRDRKRKSPDNGDIDLDVTGRHLSPAISVTSSASGSSLSDESEPTMYNGRLELSNGEYVMRPPVSNTTFSNEIPTALMQTGALRASSSQALHRIARKFDSNLHSAFTGAAPVTIVNEIDQTRPPLSFNFISKSVLGSGVIAADEATVIGCGLTSVTGSHLRCAPHMGQNIGCEYGRVCECMEYAAVDEARLTEAEKPLHAAGETAHLPKRFPYHAPYGARASCLVNFYLKSRHPVYECNPRCNCGPDCKTRVVQKGRQVPLEIFKTANRGWGLRSSVNLQEGQFIDTYRGEILTNNEADRREDHASKHKASYLYNLDKYVGADDCYVIDGEKMGGPTRFMNHSCEPNCRQYTVSTNKFDTRIYEIAFFACKPIKANTELTFDYLDKDEADADDEDQLAAGLKSSQEENSAIICKCGAGKCRGKLWV